MASEMSRSYRNLYISAFVINVVYFGVGESNVFTSPALPRLEEKGSDLAQYMIGLNEAWVVSCFALGQFLGPLTSGCLLDSIGRKPTTLMIILMLLFSCILLAVAYNPQVIYWARILGGLSFGMSVTALPVYVAEISDPHMRGTLATIPLASRSLGYFVMYAVGPYTSYNGLVIVSIAAPIVALITFCLLPESPHFLLAKGKVEKARRTLQWLRRGIPIETMELEMIALQKGIEEMRQHKQSNLFWNLISTRGNIRALYISCGLMFFLQMSGVPVIMAITQSLFNLAEVKISIKVCTLVFGGVMLIVGLMGPVVTRYFGYKTPLLISALGSCVTLVVLGLHYYCIRLGYDMSSYSLIPLVSLVAYISFYSLGFSNGAFAVVGELFAHNVKAVGTALANSIGFACALLSIQIYYAVTSAFGINFGIWSFALTNFIAVPFTFFVVPNTSEMSLAEIQEMLNRPWFNRKSQEVPLEQQTSGQSLKTPSAVSKSV